MPVIPAQSSRQNLLHVRNEVITVEFSPVSTILFFLIVVCPLLAGAAYLVIIAYVEARKYLLQWTNPEEHARRQALDKAINK